MATLLAKHALPTKENNGNFVVLGTLAEIVSDFKSVNATPTGIFGTDNDGNKFFFSYSKKVLAEIKAGNITKENMGHLEVAESNYTDENGKEQVRLKLSVPIGYSGQALNGAELAKMSTTAALTPRTISLDSIALVDLLEDETTPMKVVHSNFAA